MLSTKSFCSRCLSGRLDKKWLSSVLRNPILYARQPLRVRKPQTAPRVPPPPSASPGTPSPARRIPRLTLALFGMGAGSFVACTYWQHRALVSESRWYDEDSLSKRLRREFAKRFHRNPGGQEVIYSTVAICTAIFLAWQVPSMRNFMTNNFVMSMSAVNPIRSAILANYSHIVGWHLFANLLGLNFLSTGLVAVMRKEELTNFIFTAGLSSSLLSLMVDGVTRNYGKTSLGASGIVYAFAGFCGTAYWDRHFHLWPFHLVYPHQIRGETLVKALFVFDVAGLIFFRHRTIFDHAAHLGGLVFGVLYAYVGGRLWRRQVHRWDQWETPR